MKTTLRTYVDLLEESITAYQYYGNYSPIVQTMRWYGTDEEILIGTVCHDLLSCWGTMVASGAVVYWTPNYRIRAAHNGVVVHSLSKKQDILRMGYGMSSRTMKVMSSEINETDLIYFLDLMNLIHTRLGQGEVEKAS